MIVKIEVQPFVAGRFLFAHMNISQLATNEAAPILRGRNRALSRTLTNQRARCPLAPQTRCPCYD
jgi:hypothetical protein